MGIDCIPKEKWYNDCEEIHLQALERGPCHDPAELPLAAVCRQPAAHPAKRLPDWENPVGGRAPPSPGQKAPLCRVGWTCLRILAAAGLLVLFLKDLLPLWAVFLLLGVVILLMVLIAWRFCRCPRCGGRLRERDVGAEGICPHCGARL